MAKEGINIVEDITLDTDSVMVLPSSSGDIFTDSDNQFYCSMQLGDMSSRVRLYNTLNGDCERLSDHYGEVLEITDVVTHPVKLVNKSTGLIEDHTRAILIGKDGQMYGAVSAGVINSLQKLFAIIGRPTWPNGLKIKPTGKRTSGNYLVTVLNLEV